MGVQKLRNKGKKIYNGLGSKGEVEEVYGENHTTNANNQSNI